MSSQPTADTNNNNSERRHLANAIRALAMDAVQAANSGHPGMPMGMADIAEVLWNDHLKHNPGNPRWVDRDRFVLSNGHGSMLLYAALHLSGYPLSINDLKDFRQLGAHTAGHPELDLDLGIETTTGPLGQGVSNAVGLALAEKLLGQHYNRDGHTIVDHNTFVFLGDGCLMEGISHEACSYAGTMGLGKLICLYDDNGISIDGETDGWFTDDTPARFESYGWQVIRDVDGHDAGALSQAIAGARENTVKPTLICCKTVIGFGSPAKAGTAASHGAPLGDAEIEAARKQLGWEHGAFEVPDEVYAAWDAKAQGSEREEAWDQAFASYEQEHPELAAEFLRRMSGELPSDWQAQTDQAIANLMEAKASPATRQASLQALNELAPALPELIGGSADLTGSNCTKHATSRVIEAGSNQGGDYFYYGVREFGMSAITNGLALHGGFIPYSGTFLTFSDYARNALRMAALMGLRNIFVYTHDSIGLGEDGPTHQPVEHTASLRLMPNMDVWRPCDTIETLIAWQAAIERQEGPSSLILTRQGLPFQSRSDAQLEAVRRGAYVLFDLGSEPELIIIATGSEVHLAVEAAQEIAGDGRSVRVVSMPCAEAFERQSESWREQVLPSAVTRRIAIEAGSTGLWHRYVGPQGKIIGLDHFGESAPAGELFEKYGFSTGNVLKIARELLG
ncbi:MAG: transketolase [Pseudomonadota bacterium]